MKQRKPPTARKKHKHIWKYNTAKKERVCEAPFPFIESCGKKEIIK
ncbi:MAG: hypothetical protein HY376_03930 [Candidatus Blackburnbacteria bacterium]|nr:hypothetical protein [Candidatus Blackburnbacteria bacterium]